MDGKIAIEMDESQYIMLFDRMKLFAEQLGLELKPYHNGFSLLKPNGHGVFQSKSVAMVAGFLEGMKFEQDRAKEAAKKKKAKAKKKTKKKAKVTKKKVTRKGPKYR
jgi:hypothetical protein